MGEENNSDISVDYEARISSDDNGFYAKFRTVLALLVPRTYLYCCLY